ncbi:hypothetical protein L6V77_35855, partial [Myxococcota bacterium]|nr:hypothetical protein [Myxococcota bacterium]
ALLTEAPASAEGAGLAARMRLINEVHRALAAPITLEALVELVLDRAFAQAADYFDGLPERDLPRYILVSDFARFRLYDLENGKESEFKLKDLYKHVRLFGFIAGYAPVKIEEQDPVNLKAALAMGRLHDALKATGYAGHALEVLLVRLLFCLFADDTTLFEPKGAFRDYIEDVT